MVKEIITNSLKFVGKVALIIFGAGVTAEVAGMGAQAACNDYAVINGKKLANPQVVAVKKSWNPFSKKAKVTVQTNDLYLKNVKYQQTFVVDKRTLGK